MKNAPRTFRISWRVTLLVGLGFVLSFPQRQAMAADSTDYLADVEFALKELPRHCGPLLKLKKIDWPAVSKQFLKEAKEIESDPDHLVLLVRLLARLKDGHSSIRPLEKGKDVKWPLDTERTGPGMFWCRAGKKVYIKNSWSGAKGAGITPGMEVISVDGEPVEKWIAARQETLSDLMGYSTEQQAFFYATHWGLKDKPLTKLKLQLRNLKGRRETKELRYMRGVSYTPQGPAFPPKGTKGTRNVFWSKTEEGYGYIHLRRCKGTLPEEVDQALAAVGDAPGIILDFRGNSGGGFDHEAFMGRFIPKGETLDFNKRYRSAGENPYGGPVVCIVDATCRSAGETAVAIFKEDGRGYLIGESPTAGMSSSKRTIELPSGLFSLYVSVRSNMSRSNKGRGLEGVGVIPHELVQFDPEDLAEQRDTLIKVAAERLKKFPQSKVPYKAKKK